ncbi:polypeptide chain release methylase [Formosa agariphila KMM 3901]|uniref:Polypeptide chain release methylase n=1 Tax=Formosa agariphila (strain DSM 15362 / KCTC 12365 / LMG 23005 / KMM 3901 / M-2Alg 35-1) TaxID=1347342 RepID=T2KHN1_FORAG|nr:methyltransferase [Formosa agariphila]CDF77913.1 polypeptide chain release methylase [Formosa agariphila KMM 3901]
MSADLRVNKPTPFFSEQPLIAFSRASNVALTIKALEVGKPVLIAAFYSDGLDLLKALHQHLKKRFPNGTFKEQRAYRLAYQKLSKLIYINIVDHKLIVKKAPAIGWLAKLYPEQTSFLLPFTKVQGLNSAWQWYKNGIDLPVLRSKIHPYYGVYFPTRFDHLILFDNWLKRYNGPKKSAIDVGIGSGVLALQLVKFGFQKVFGTDTNPNAIVGLTESMEDTKLSRKIELDFAPLFGKWEKQTELIVFNPPWLPAAHDLDHIDEAISYPETLFSEFFKAAKKRLLPEGKLVLIFSNLAQLTQVTDTHPIADELAVGGRFKLEQCLKRPVKAASSQTKRDQNWRATEDVELWILVHA